MADSPLPPPGMADALNVEPAVAIAAATKPIAILRIMMLTSIRSEHPSLSESNPAVLIELQRAALSPGVRASKPRLVACGRGCGLRVIALRSTSRRGRACSPLSTGISRQPGAQRTVHARFGATFLRAVATRITAAEIPRNQCRPNT